MCQKTDGYGNWNVRQVQCLALDRPAPSLHSSIAAKWQVGCRMCACNQHARASCLLQEPLINSQTSKTQIPNSKSGSTSGDWSDLLLHGFSLNGVWFLSSGHSLQKLPIYIYFPPPCVCCLSSWPQLESAEWWTHGHVGVLSWVSQALCWHTQTVPGHPVWLLLLQTAGQLVWYWCLLPCAFLRDCFTAFQLERVTFSGGRGHRKMWLGWCIFACCTLGEKQWAVVFWVSNGTFRWDELLVIRLIWGLLYAKPFPAPSLLDL